MTVQANEVIEYRGESYYLVDFPFNSFLEENPNLEFPSYSTAHWRGYQGYWLLQDDKLFLSKIESAKLRIENIFDTDGPILAKWFSGTLLIGLGEGEYSEFCAFFEEYLWLEIINGEVKERKIIKKFSDDFTIDFGKFKDKNLSSILKGRFVKYSKPEDVCRNYVEDLIRFFLTNDFENNIVLPFFNLTPELAELFDNIPQLKIRYFLTQDTIAVEKHLYNDEPEEDDSEIFLNFLASVLTTDFRQMREIRKVRHKIVSSPNKTEFLNPSPSYAEWAIKNVDNFCIPPHILCEEFDIMHLVAFQVEILSTTVLKYIPIFTTSKFSFSDSIQELNKLKFLNKFNLKYDTVYDFYVYTKDEAERRFKVYLDESFTPEEDDESEFDDEIFIQSEEDYYTEERSYEKYGGAHGYDDDTIDSAFEGDPDNCWNVD